MEVLIEAIVVAVSSLTVGGILGYLFDMLSKSVKMDRNVVYALTLFFTGFLLHLIFEILGLNEWYVKQKIKK